MLKDLKNSELNERIKSLARDERALTKTIVEHIAEVDRRKLFLKMAYPSLFEYLTKEVGYSAGAAQRRIDAARLFARVPEVAVKIESGVVNLAQISKMQQACRVAKKEGRIVTVGEQKQILEKIENRSIEETELIVAKEFNVSIQLKEKKRIQKDESVRVELTFSKEEMALMQRAREISSHKTGGGGLKETILAMAESVVRSADRNVKAAERPVTNSTATVAAKIGRTATVAVKSGRTAAVAVKCAAIATRVSAGPKTITPRLRREILKRDRCCQYRDETTGKMCGSRHFLEVDHIQPRFAGGSNEKANLRALCNQHNIFRYHNELGKVETA